MFSHITGSPHSAVLYDRLIKHNMLAIPLSWSEKFYTEINYRNLLPIGVTYIFESINAISYLKEIYYKKVA